MSTGRDKQEGIFENTEEPVLTKQSFSLENGTPDLHKCYKQNAQPNSYQITISLPQQVSSARARLVSHEKGCPRTKLKELYAHATKD